VKLVLLVGSGSSIGAGLPGIDKLTQEVLKTAHVSKSGGMFRFSLEPSADRVPLVPMDDGRIEEIREFLAALKRTAEGYFAPRWPGRKANYEDLSYIARQIEDAIGYEYENAALVPLIQQSTRTYERSARDLENLAQSAADFIHEYVSWRLQEVAPDLGRLRPILDALADASLERCDVFTLNHDTLLERALTERGIAYADGFEEQFGTLRLWTDTYTTAPSRRLFKLHGSVDWFRYALELDGWQGQVVARTDGDPWHPFGPNKEDLGTPAGGKAEMLVGTFNKILGYPAGTYADQHARLHESLRGADAVLVVGYGFGDKAINSRVVAWMEKPRQRRRMLLIDPAANPMPPTTRGAIEQKWDRWRAAGVLTLFPFPLHGVTWSEIREKLA